MRPTSRCGGSSPRPPAAPLLDVGAGTGRVALDLARRGHAVVAIDSDPDLVARSPPAPVPRISQSAR